MARPIIHNRYLPEWLHRLFCAVYGMALFATFWVLLLSWTAGGNFVSYVRPLGWLVPLVGCVCFLLAPGHSVVRGLAGEAGYDELVSPNSSSKRTHEKPRTA